MRTISKKDFLEKFASSGLCLNERYLPPQTLVFPATQASGWSWDIPESPEDLTRLVASLFEACDELDSFFLFPRRGAWGSGDTLKLSRMAAVFSGTGCQPDADEVLVFPVDEIDAVKTLFSATLTYGVTVSDDVFVVPSHGRVILYADHHEAVHAEFANADFRNAFTPRIPEFPPQ